MKMENITELDIENFDGSITKHILIDRGNDEFTSMPKAIWDEQQAQQTQGGLN